MISLRLTIKGQEFEMTLDEAKELHRELEALFEKKERDVQFVPVPNYPAAPYVPPMWFEYRPFPYTVGDFPWWSSTGHGLNVGGAVSGNDYSYTYMGEH